MNAKNKRRWPALLTGFGFLIVLGVGILCWAGWFGERVPRNVILISIDTLRADHLGFMGHERPTSPRLDQLASESIVFEQAIAQATSTLPSHATLLTSLNPTVHRANVDRATPLAEGYTTLAEILRDRSFKTAAFVEGGQMASMWNLDQGFDLYDVTERADFDHGDWFEEDLAGILGRAGRWIGENQAEPFFCFIHSYVVHYTYTNRPPFTEMFADAEVCPGVHPMNYRELDEIEDRLIGKDDPTARCVAALYDGMIRYTDEQVGQFLDRLAGQRVLEDTMIVFLSDHGEEFGEHGKVAKHGHTVFDELVHVPLIFRVPGKRPQRVSRQVRLLDVTPTILGLLGIDFADADFQGENLLDATGSSNGDIPVFMEQERLGKHMIGLRVDGHKLIRYPPNLFCAFDLGNDPTEQTNIYDSQDARMDSWGRLLEDMTFENSERMRYQSAPVEIDPQTQEQLRALGYLKETASDGGER